MDNKKTPAERANEIYHHGIRGMKWGVRRYQNPDGSLTEAGTKRYRRDTGMMDDATIARYDRGIADGRHAHTWVKEDMGNAKKVADESASAMQKIKNANDASMRSKGKAKLDLSKMSDQELREALNRYDLEQRYNNAFAPSTVSKGQVAFGKIVEGAGTALTLTGSALAIALAVKQLKGD